MVSSSHLFAAVAGYVGRPEASGAVGVFRRPVAGGAWRHVLPELECWALSVHPETPDIVLAGTADGVWRSTDHGQSFARARFPDTGRQVWSFLVSAADPDLIYAGASPIGVYRSRDRGASWRRLPDPKMPQHCKGPFATRVMRLAERPGRPQELYAALEIGGVMASRNGGETWEDRSGDLIRLSEAPHLKSKIVSDTFSEGMLDGHALAVCSAAPESVVLALRMGLFRTLDGGRSWQDMGVGRFSPTTYARDVKASPHDGKTLFAALSVAASSHDGGLYRSRDAGASWERFDKVKVHGTIMSLALHPSDPQQVYLAARYDGEIHGTADGGKTWQAMPLPGPVKDLYAVACG